SATNGGTALAMYDPKGLSLTLNVSETDIEKVQVGQPVSITFDAIANERATGTVTQVSPVATSGQDVVTYAVSVSFEPGSIPIKVGMNATSLILVESRQGVIQVPTSAIRTVG